MIRLIVPNYKNGYKPLNFSRDQLSTGVVRPCINYKKIF